MLHQFITSRRVRRILADAMTDADAAFILRAHSVRFHYSTAGGELHIVIPTAAGAIRVYRDDAARALATGPDRGRPFPDWYQMPVLHTTDQ